MAQLTSEGRRRPGKLGSRALCGPQRKDKSALRIEGTVGEAEAQELRPAGALRPMVGLLRGPQRAHTLVVVEHAARARVSFGLCRQLMRETMPRQR